MPPRKTASKADNETEAPRRSTRISTLPKKAEEVVKKVVKPRAKKGEGKTTKKAAEKDGEDAPVAAEPTAEKENKRVAEDEPVDGEPPAKKTKPASKANSKPPSKAAAAKPPSRAGSKKPSSKVGGAAATAKAAAGPDTIAEE